MVGEDTTEKVEMRAHSAVLSKSPVLARICTDPFVEAATRCIKLPEDDPTAVKLLLRYLYSDDYPPLREDCTDTAMGGLDILQKERLGKTCGKMYILGDKYLLPQLKQITLEKLAIISKHLVLDMVLPILMDVYQNIPSTEVTFRTFVRQTLVPSQEPAWSFEDLEPYVSGGSLLAVDILQAELEVAERRALGHNAISKAVMTEAADAMNLLHFNRHYALVSLQCEDCDTELRAIRVSMCLLRLRILC